MGPRKLDGSPWGVSDSVRMHAWFRTEAQCQLRQRDHDLYGIPLDGRVNQPVKRGTTTEWVVNPAWSKNRHSGKDREALEEKLWTEFSSEPRDPDAELAKIGLARIIQCAVKRRASSAGEIPARQGVAPAGSNRSGGGGNETVEAFGVRGRRWATQRACRP